jgi:hypothetical protein
MSYPNNVLPPLSYPPNILPLSNTDHNFVFITNGIFCEKEDGILYIYGIEGIKTSCYRCKTCNAILRIDEHSDDKGNYFCSYTHNSKPVYDLSCQELRIKDIIE